MFKNKRSGLWIVAIALTLAVALSVPMFAGAAIDTNDNPVNLVMTNPTEDCKTSMMISWHSPLAQCTISYTTADDTEFAKATAVNVDGTAATLDYFDLKADKYYKYAYTITGLTEDTQYIYKVSNTSGESAVYTFKTAGTKAFRFIAMGDTHADGGSNFTYVKQTATMLNNVVNKIGPYDLTIFTGDYVETGATYNNWVQWNDSKLTTSSVMSLTIGNHDTDNRAIGVKRISNKWFVNSLGNPVNGPEGLESVYWFNYNGVLFLCVDTLAPEMSEFTAAQKNLAVQLQWMKDVAAAQQGKYQYIVVYQHNPYGLGSSNEIASWSYYGQMYKTCDEIGADFVLGGDNHEYSRTNRLYNNQVVDADGDVGSYYVTNPMVTGGTMNKTVKGSGLIAARFAGAGTGCTVFTVTEDSLTMQLVNKAGKVIDEVSVPSRRDAVVVGTELAGPVATATPEPTAAPTAAPTQEPTAAPTQEPETTESAEPTSAPTGGSTSGDKANNDIVLPIVLGAAVIIVVAAIVVIILKKK